MQISVGFLLLLLLLLLKCKTLALMAGKESLKTQTEPDLKTQKAEDKMNPTFMIFYRMAWFLNSSDYFGRSDSSFCNSSG